MQKGHIKKYLAASVLGLAVAVLTGGTSHAAFVGLQRSTNTATVTFTQQGTITMGTQIKKTIDNTDDTAVNWLSVVLPSSFTVANDYVQLSFQITAQSAGIETYTDNTASDANPRYTGVISSTTQTPAGLIDVDSTTVKLPTIWSVKATTTTPPAPADPNNTGDPNSFQWFYHEDRAQVMNNQGASNFVDGDPYITVLNNNGIHFSQGPNFGPAPSPVDVYYEADFRTAVTPETYKTSTLRFEAFTD